VYDDLDEGKSKAEADPYDSAGRRATAEKAYDAANAAEDAGRLGDARRLLLEGWSHWKNWPTAYELANVSFRLDLSSEAIFYADFVLRSSKPLPEERDQAAKWKAQALARVAHLRVTAVPHGACIVIDGLNVGNAPLAGPVLVNPGKHRVQARHHGAAAVSEVSLKEGATAEVTLTAK
jgi:hypothetical protein